MLVYTKKYLGRNIYRFEERSEYSYRDYVGDTFIDHSISYIHKIENSKKEFKEIEDAENYIKNKLKRMKNDRRTKKRN